MFKPLSLYIGLKYTRAKKKNHFVSFISFSSMIGIALGVMVLITVLSVMNGFDEEIHKRFFDMAPEITITGPGERMTDWQALEQKLLVLPGVKAVAPFVGSQGLMTFEGQVQPIVLTGISPPEEETVTKLNDKLIAGSTDQLSQFGVILGKRLADNLGIFLGDKVTVMIPEATVTLAGMIPRFKRFTVTGVFSAGAGFNFDSSLAFVDLHNAQTLLRMGSAVSGIKLKIKHIYQAPELSAQIQTMLGPDYQVGNWTQQFGAFFQAVKLEKTMMFMILLLIIAVAAFNLVSSLVMVVNDKQSEIAILRTIGATPSLIHRIFMIQGMTIGLFGTGFGLILGLLLASNATGIVNFLQALFHVKVISSSIYFVDYLPSKIIFSDIVQICFAALLMSFLATVYPAKRASKTVIAEALHYE